MSVAEKIGQLVQYSAGQPTGLEPGRTDYDDMIARGQVGSLFNVIDPHEIQQIPDDRDGEIETPSVPILFGLDVIGG